MLAGIGIAVGAGGGSASSAPDRDISGDIQKSQGTGTVLGNEGAKSESIKNSLELLADNSRIELTYTQQMLSGINRTADGISGFVATIAKTQGLRGTAADQARWGIGGDMTLVDSGLGFLPEQTIGSIIQAGIQGFGYGTTYFREKGGQGSAGINKSDLTGDFADQFKGIIVSTIDSVVGAASALALNNNGLVDRIMAVMPAIGDTTDVKRITGKDGGGLLSLKGLKGDEISDELNAVFSSIADQIATAVLPEIKDFQQLGEGYFETLVRVSSGIEKAQVALEQFGISAIDYRDIVNKAGDTATEIVRQSVNMLEKTASGGLTGVGQIIDLFVGSTDDLLDLYTTLSDVRGAIRSVGAAAVDLSAQMVRGAGGIDKLQSGLGDYLDGFFTDQEKLAAQQARLAEQFEIIGVTVPASNAAFRALVQGIDTSTDAGQKFFGQLVALSGAFSSATAAAEDVATAQAEAAQEAADAAAEIAEAAKEAADAQIAAQQAAADAILASWNKLKGQFDSVADQFLSGADLQSYRVTRIQDVIAPVGLNFSAEQILGAGADDFKALFFAIDKSSAAGRDQASALLSVWDAFKKLNSVTVEAPANIAQLADTAFAALQASIAVQKSKLSEQYNFEVARISAATQASVSAAEERLSSITTIFNALDSAIASTQIQSVELDKARRAAAQAVLQQAVAGVRQGQSVTAFAGLDDAIAAVTQPSQSLFATFEQYAIDQAKTAADILNLRNAAQGQMSVADMTLTAIKAGGDAQLAALKASYDQQVAGLDMTLDYWKQQINSLKGVDDRVLSVQEAVERLQEITAMDRSAPVVSELKALRDENVALRKALEDGLATLNRSNKQTADVLMRNDTGEGLRTAGASA
ncbi:MAG: hypothetical protein EOO22_08260 [Comamonadaceae bacterium]|nr:MAG: hypothetical protein EOO22_08260 [Comamonadaceae bacterium]